MSRRTKAFLCRSITAGILAVSAATNLSAETQLRFVDYFEQGVDAPQGLKFLYSSAITSDGRFMYTATVDDNFCSAYSLDSDNGHLTQVQNFQANLTGNPSAPTAPVHCLISKDDQSLYINAYVADTIFCYSLDPITGHATEIQQLTHNLYLDGFAYSTFSPDGRFMYGTLLYGNGITIFERFPDTGLLNGVQTVFGPDLEGEAALQEAIYPVVSPDGKHLYVGCYGDDSIVTFDVNQTTGMISFKSVLYNGQGGVVGLDGPRWLEISKDGRNVYATGMDSPSVLAFARNADTGALTHLSTYHGDAGMESSRVVRLSPDQTTLFSNGYFGNTWFQFARSPIDGDITFERTYTDGFEEGALGLSKTRELSFSPNGKFAYFIRYNDDGEVNGGIGIYRLDDSSEARTDFWSIF